MQPRFAAVIFIFVLVTLVFPIPARADGIIIPDPPVCDPEPCPPGPFPISQLEIRYHHVDVLIDQQIAVTKVDQVFYNPNDWTVEGTYIFPIPVGAVVTDFVLWIDGEPVQGEVLDADEARRTYEEIVRNLMDPALLEYADRGAVRARIYPIPPQGERRIQLEYTQTLTAEDGLVHYVYPLNTEKFSTEPLENVRVSVDLRTSQPIRAVYSPSHPAAVSRENDYHVLVGYEASDVLPDTDFSLYYSIGESEALHLLSFRDPGDPVDSDGFFLLLLAPRPQVTAEPLPKDLILVLDRSGSMEGEKFVQAQEALKYILKHLNPGDRFNLITFSTGLETFAGELQGAVDVPDALAWIDRLGAVGSTDINRALLEAAAMASADTEGPGRPTYLIFLTDGLPTEGVIQSGQILDNFEASAPDHLRLFAFGVGYDVDTFLLDSLAEAHHGTSTYVLPGEPIDEVLSTFYGKISMPVLTNLALDFGDLAVYDLYPDPLPDLFSGSQIAVVGRYREGGRTDIKLTGEVDGKIQTFNFPDQAFTADSTQAQSGVSAAIPRLWATRKIGHLLNQIRLHGPEQELIDQIVRLSIRYGIITPYTSYLVTEDEPLGQAEQDRIAEEVFNEMEAAPAAPSYGQKAVEQAAGEGALRDAESGASTPAEVSGRVRVLGPRAYVLSDGVWVDTAFDPDQMQTTKVGFLTDVYFELAATDPQLGAAFALGSQVIALSQGTAYEVVPADPAQVVGVTPDPDQPENPAETAAAEPTFPPAVTATSAAEQTAPPSGRGLPCIGAALPLTLLPLLFVSVRRRTRR